MMEKKEPLDAETLDQIMKRVIFTESRQLREGNLRDIAVVKKHVATIKEYVDAHQED